MLILEYATRLVRRYPWLHHLPLFGLASQLEEGMSQLAEDRPDLLTESPHRIDEASSPATTTETK